MDSAPVRVLMVEDSADDVELMQRTLRDGGIEIESRTVASEAELRAVLSTFAAQIVLVDWVLPGFAGAAAMTIVREWDESVPCIIISGKLGHQLVARAIRRRATDYVSKRHMDAALVPAVRRALADTAARQEQSRLVAELDSLRDSMAGSLDAMADPFVLCTAIRDQDGRIGDFQVRFVNLAAAASMGAPRAELVGRSLEHVTGRVFMTRFFKECVRVVETGEPYAVKDLEITHEDGARAPGGIFVDLTVTKHEDGFFVVWRNVTEHVRDVRRLKRLGSAIEQASEMVVITDAAGTIEFVNPAFEQGTGYSGDELIGANPRLLKSGHQSASFYAAMWGALIRGQPWVANFTNRRKDGSTNLTTGVISPIKDDTGVISGYVGTTRDVTDEREHEERGLRMARERALIAGTIRAIDTREPPEVIAQAVCDQVVSMQDMATAGLYVFEIDGQAALYGFAAPLDISGQPHRIPRQATTRLRERAERGPWIQDWRRAQGHAHNELYALLGVKTLAYAPVHYGRVLIGVLVVSSAVQPALTDALPALVEFADLNGTLIGPKVASRTEAEATRTRIRKIIDKRAFHPVYQPIVDITRGRIIGYEALTRFDDKVPPDTHFAAAQAIGMGGLLEGATLRAALDGAASLQRDAWLSFNVSPSVLGSDELRAALASTTERQLVVEVTEQEQITDYAALRRDVQRLGPHVRLAVDDAGAGFASLRHILELRAAFVKLDRSFITGIDDDRAKQALVAGMRHFARSAGFSLIAEGVETRAELASLRELDIHFAQGYLLGRPQPAHRVTGRKPAERRPRQRLTAAAAQRKSLRPWPDTTRLTDVVVESREWANDEPVDRAAQTAAQGQQ